MIVAKASYKDHKELLKLSRLSPYTKGFADVRYVQEYYKEGWILKVIEHQRIVAFACIRHCKRQPWTTIYYLGVLPEVKGCGIGRLLTERIARESPHKQLRLGVDEANKEGWQFWDRLGFIPLGKDTYNKQGGRIIQMVRNV